LATGAEPLGHEGVVAIPCADVEDAAASDVGEVLLGEGLLGMTLGDDTITEVDGVEPLDGVGTGLNLTRRGHVRGN